jgi:hypothetical protein
MRRIMITVLAIAVTLGFAPIADAAERTDGCAKLYTRAHFHAAAQSTYSTAFPSDRKKRTLNRTVRCQRHRSSVAVVRMHRRRYRHAWLERFRFVRLVATIPAWGRSHLASIASCESGGDPTAIGGGGAYRGMYQFSFSTWGVVGGYGDPAAASVAEQTWRAWLLLSRHGAGHWPVCG